MADPLDLLEQRVSTLEKLVGSSEKIDPTKGYETINCISNKLTKYLHDNSKISNSLKSLNDISKYTDFEILNEIEDENSIKAKTELILAEEDYIKKINKDFDNLRTFSKILDNKDLNDIPSLMQKLKDLSGKHCDLKESEKEYSSNVKEFLATYFGAVQSINETMENLNIYLEN